MGAGSGSGEGVVIGPDPTCATAVPATKAANAETIKPMRKHRLMIMREALILVRRSACTLFPLEVVRQLNGVINVSPHDLVGLLSRYDAELRAALSSNDQPINGALQRSELLP